MALDPSLFTYHIMAAVKSENDIILTAGKETIVSETLVKEDQEVENSCENSLDEVEKEEPYDQELSPDPPGSSKVDHPLLKLKTTSVISIEQEVRSLRVKIQKEKNIDFENFDPESVLTDEQKRRDSLDNHLYRITCFPDVVQVETVYTCKDVPILESVGSFYEHNESILDDTLVSSYEAHIQPLRKNVSSFYESNSLTRCEVPKNLELHHPVLHVIPTTLASYQPVKKNVESSYAKCEISVLTEIDKIFEKSELSHKLIPTEFVQNSCTYEHNYQTVYENNEFQYVEVLTEYKSNHIQQKILPSIYQRFVEFDSFLKRVDEYIHSQVKRKPIPASLKHNVPKLCPIPSKYKRKIPIMETGRVSSFANYGSQRIQPEAAFLCNQEPEVKRNDKTIFRHEQAVFKHGENFQPNLLHNAILRKQLPVEFLDQKLEIFPVETEYILNEPILVEVDE